jgi:hypothetical protein
MQQRGTNWKDAAKTALTHPGNGKWRRDARYWGGIILAGDQVLPRSAVRFQLVTYLKVKAGLELTEREERFLASLDPAVWQRIGFQP